MKNDLLNLTLRRRSTRHYLNDDIPDEIIQEILKTALTAPSSWGAHPIHFVVIKIEPPHLVEDGDSWVVEITTDSKDYQAIPLVPRVHAVLYIIIFFLF